MKTYSVSLLFGALLISSLLGSSLGLAAESKTALKCHLQISDVVTHSLVVTEKSVQIKETLFQGQDSPQLLLDQTTAETCDLTIEWTSNHDHSGHAKLTLAHAKTKFAYRAADAYCVAAPKYARKSGQ